MGTRHSDSDERSRRSWLSRLILGSGRQSRSRFSRAFGVGFRALLVGVLAFSPHLLVRSADRDGDGIADCVERDGMHLAAGEPTIAHTDPRSPDTDDDGIPDGEEAGPSTSSAGPNDLIDFVGDVYTGCRSQTYSALSNPNLTDTDDDGLNDAHELSDGSNAFVPDTDGDGLSDSDEREWSSDPNADDTDGDGIQDGDDVDANHTPVGVDEGIDAATWLIEFNEGLLLGDFKEIDSVPQLTGALVRALASTNPVIGATADIEDTFANVLEGDWSGALEAAGGLLPGVGDLARSSEQLTKFAGKYPEKIRAIGRAIAGEEKLPDWMRIALLKLVSGADVDTLRSHGLTDDEILEMAKRGTDLDEFARTLDRAGSPGIVRGIPGNIDSDGFATSWKDAAAAVVEYAEGRDGNADAASGPVYIGGFQRPPFTGGRYYDSCTECTPEATAENSTLRVAKLGTQIYSETLQAQIDKDAVLTGDGYTVEWHFVASRTGCAIDPRLLDALEQAGITYYIHLPS